MHRIRVWNMQFDANSNRSSEDRRPLSPRQYISPLPFCPLTQSPGCTYDHCFIYLAGLVESPEAPFWPEIYGQSLICLSVQALFNVGGLPRAWPQVPSEYHTKGNEHSL
jgi:hypothetical protein